MVAAIVVIAFRIPLYNYGVRSRHRYNFVIEIVVNRSQFYHSATLNELINCNDNNICMKMIFDTIEY